MADEKTWGIETRSVHGDGSVARTEGAVTTPIFQSSTYATQPGAGYHDLAYIRLNNTPGHESLHRQLAALEGSESALTTASGMAAITTSLLTVLGAGEHLLVQRGLYGGTHNFITSDLETFGIGYDLIDPSRPESWQEKLTPKTRAIYVESMSNPLLQIPDLPAVARFAQHNGLVSLIDNTFASPVNYLPLRHQFDIILHSATKYLNGHSDIVAGVVAGNRAWIDRIKCRLDHLGGCLDPHACFLLQRGLKTLPLRVRQQNVNALALARFLEGRQEVDRVIYPGLEGHPQHQQAKRWFTGFGGVVSFEMVQGEEPAQKVVDRLQLALSAPSLGGVETLITRPITTSHAGLAEKAAAMGITPGLVRVAVGIESTQDLLADFDQALTSAVTP